MFEGRRTPLLSRREYFARQVRWTLLATSLVLSSLGLGVVGYHMIGDLSWIDATHAAAMILTGMGPVAPMTSTGAKLFESAYALFSGVAFLSSCALLLTPAVHRLMHHFHLEVDVEDDKRVEQRTPRPKR